jgi:hypothetical protein
MKLYAVIQHISMLIILGPAPHIISTGQKRILITCYPQFSGTAPQICEVSSQIVESRNKTNKLGYGATASIQNTIEPLIYLMEIKDVPYLTWGGRKGTTGLRKG